MSLTYHNITHYLMDDVTLSLHNRRWKKYEYLSDTYNQEAKWALE